MSNVVRLEFPMQAEKIDPIGQIVDDLGAVREQIKVLEGKEKMLKYQITKSELNSITGYEFNMIIRKTNRKSIDNKRLKSEHGDEWYNSYCKKLVISSIITNRK